MKKIILDKIILGIDPGTALTGYGLLHHKSEGLRLMEQGVISLKSGNLDHPQKLKIIFDKVLDIIDRYHPDEMAIEAPFFGKNIQSMLKLGRAQGVVMAAAMHRSIPIFEYAPRKIKQSVTGRGNASKDQVYQMLLHLLPELQTQPVEFMDASDALATALCHHFQRGKFVAKKNGTVKKSSSSWASFLANNPEKIKKK